MTVPPHKVSGPLSPEAMRSLAWATLKNSVALMEDALILIEAESWPRAYSIAVLAAEEFGKNQLLIGTIARDNEPPEYWKEFWKDFYAHKAKLARTGFHAANFLPEELISTFIEHFDAAFRDQRRELGLYVDFRDGNPILPADSISKEEAMVVCQVFAEVILGYASLCEVAALDEALEAASDPAAEMRAALDSGDADLIAQTFLKTTGHPMPERILRLYLRPELQK
jgi:AbiV family abortive infection protein